MNPFKALLKLGWKMTGPIRRPIQERMDERTNELVARRLRPLEQASASSPDRREVRDQREMIESLAAEVVRLRQRIVELEERCAAAKGGAAPHDASVPAAPNRP